MLTADNDNCESTELTSNEAIEKEILKWKRNCRYLNSLNGTASSSQWKENWNTIDNGINTSLNFDEIATENAEK